MPQINIHLESISGEKFVESDKPSPGQVQISTNVNILDLESVDDFLNIPFVVTISYNPSVAQINLKGEAKVRGEKEKLSEIQGKYSEKEQPPQFLIQTIINHSIMEATILSRSLNIPPPIPFPKSQEQNQAEESGNLDYVG